MARYDPQPGGVVWGDDPYQRQYPYQSQHGKLLAYSGLAAGLGAAGFVKFGGRRGWEHLSRAAQIAERTLPPFQWAKTFRYPTRMSPMAAPAMERWGPELYTRKEGKGAARRTVLNSGLDLEFLKSTTGLNKGQLQAAGLAEHGVTFRRNGLVQGDLFIGKTKVASNIGLMKYADNFPDSALIAHISLYDPDLANKLSHEAKRRTERELGLTKASSVTDMDTPFTAENIRKGSRSKRVEGLFAPHGASPKHVYIPLGHGKGSFGFMKNAPEALKPLVSGIRGNMAFASQRMNMVIQGVVEKVPYVGDTLSKHLLRKGSFLKMQYRYAGLAAAVGLGALALDQMDWFKREHPIAGSQVYGGVAAAGSLLVGASPLSAGLVGVGAAAATSAPGMEGGIKQGIATYYMKAKMAQSRVSNAPLIKYLPFIGGEYRDYMGETYPGIDKPSYALAAGLGTFFTAEIYTAHRRGLRTGDGFVSGMKGMQLARLLDPIAPGDYSSQYKKVMESYGHEPNMLKAAWAGGRGEYRQKTPHPLALDAPKSWFDASIKAHETAGEMIKRNLSPQQLRQNELDAHWAEKIRKTDGTGKRLWTQLRAYAEGADVADELKIRGKWYRTKTIPLGRTGTIIGAGALLFATVGGQFAAKDTPEELKAKMEGRELEPVRKGRYWEGGGTPWEGKHIMYHRPHWYAMMTSRAKEKALWGPDEDKLSPISKFFRKNFTYELERKHYSDRPYPITGTAFEEMPFMAGLITPISRIVKPARLMHVEDFAMAGSDGGIKLMHEIEERESRPSEALGGFGPGAPISPYAGRARIGQQIYQWTEQAGLEGYMTTMGFGLNPFSIKSMTGTDSFYSQDNWLESANQMHSLTRDFWERELGGGFFTTEAYRRFFPRPRSEIGSYNPIANNMPSWIPEQLQTGDPYAKIASGEVRMPGAGYAAVHAELRDTDPENYPVWHQYAILSDVAWWSQEFRATAAKVERLEQAGALPDSAQETVSRAKKRLENRQQKLQFDRYIDGYNKDTADWGMGRMAMGRTWQAGTHGVHKAVDQLEYLLPFGFRPAQKLMPYVSPVEEYERSMVYGTRMGFWDELGRDWLRPAQWTAAHNLLGYDGIPPWLKEVRENEEYFDKLEYQKWKTLAEGTSDKYKRREYSRLAKKTIAGRNPYEESSYVRSSLPTRERDFYEAFVNTTNPKERERILELVPQYMRSIYTAQWQKADYAETGDEKLRETIEAGQRSGGMDIDQSKYQKYSMEAGPNTNYSDWYNASELDEYFKDNPLPRPNWIGFHPEVDLADVKLKMVLNEGGDPQDYGIWDAQQRLLARKPYINDDTLEPVRNGPATQRRILSRLASENGVPQSQIGMYQYYSSFPRNDIDIDMYDSREMEMAQQRRLYGR